MQELIAGFGETTASPLRRPKTRGAICEWYKLVEWFTTYQPTEKQADLFNALQKVSRGVDADLAEKLGDAYPENSLRTVILQNSACAVPSRRRHRRLPHHRHHRHHRSPSPAKRLHPSGRVVA